MTSLLSQRYVTGQVRLKCILVLSLEVTSVHSRSVSFFPIARAIYVLLTGSQDIMTVVNVTTGRNTASVLCKTE